MTTYIRNFLIGVAVIGFVAFYMYYVRNTPLGW